MTAPVDLAALIAEGERLCAEVTPANAKNWYDLKREELNARFALYAFTRRHLPRLLSLAAAGAEMREAESVGRGTNRPPYAYGPEAVHAYGCAAGRIGKKWGPCDCGGEALNERIRASRAVWDSEGL